jgi:hypothetical protein
VNNAINDLFFETLELRYKFEDMTSDFKFLNDSDRSNINTLKWFVEDGYKSNSLRDNFEEAKKLALIIIENSERIINGEESTE